MKNRQGKTLIPVVSVPHRVVRTDVAKGPRGTGTEWGILIHLLKRRVRQQEPKRE
jgi:hypothetical protein